MSHRLFDDLAMLNRGLAATDVEISEARKARLVDFHEIADLRKTRDTLLEQIAAKEQAIRDDNDDP